MPSVKLDCRASCCGDDFPEDNFIPCRRKNIRVVCGHFERTLLSQLYGKTLGKNHFSLSRYPPSSVLGGCGNQMVKVSDSCQEFESSTAEDPPCRENRCELNKSMLKRPPVDVVEEMLPA
ncbi:hypothetical protein TNCV_4298251 [Trichonephila clavipes]|nr:hypothetical protein TNCV_4298251 [Trichonephila clavipes]